jgi:hypothetical protein
MQPSEPPAFLFVLIPIAFAVMFTAIWSGVCGLLATVSGWRAMATNFRCPEGLRGTALASGYANRVGVVSYRATLSFEATPQGLIARVMRIFPFHPAVLIPWGAIQLQRGGGIFFAGTMTVAGGATFALNGDALGAIEQCLAAPGVAATR